MSAARRKPLRQAAQAQRPSTPVQALAFSSTGIGMGVGGVPLARNSALLEIGADTLIAEGATIGLSYIGQYSGDFTDNGLRGRLSWKF